MKDPLNICLCPYCCKRVAKRASVCRHCGYEWNCAPWHPYTIRECLNGARVEQGANKFSQADVEAYTAAIARVVMAAGVRKL